MASKSNIKVTGEWQSLYTLISESVGTGVELQNVSTYGFLMFEGTTKPAEDSLDGFSVRGAQEGILSRVTISSGSEDVWVKSLNPLLTANVAVGVA